jgi:hypothetical protein
MSLHRRSTLQRAFEVALQSPFDDLVTTSFADQNLSTTWFRNRGKSPYLGPHGSAMLTTVTCDRYTWSDSVWDGENISETSVYIVSRQLDMAAIDRRLATLDENIVGTRTSQRGLSAGGRAYNMLLARGDWIIKSTRTESESSYSLVRNYTHPRYGLLEVMVWDQRGRNERLVSPAGLELDDFLIVVIGTEDRKRFSILP